MLNHIPGSSHAVVISFAIVQHSFDHVAINDCVNLDYKIFNEKLIQVNPYYFLTKIIST